jgi:UDP-glucuronate 4-epimerase
VKVVVTGVAGFIASTLAERLVADGADVVGVDCFTPYYDRAVKEANLEAVRASDRFTFVDADLRTAELAPLLDGADVVFHQAAQPGVRLSWSAGFGEYESCNVLATQRLLDAASSAGVGRFVYASSSSIYGRTAAYPTTEAELPRPHSPYGVTKLAGEHLCGVYAANKGLPTIALRYFTVYGPRQRPDMAMHKLLRAGIEGTSFPLFGDGSAARDFTYVDDVVAANLAAGQADVAPGTVVNIAGGGETTMANLVEVAGEVVGRPIEVDRGPEQMGDVPRTGGSIDLARELLGWEPKVALREGLTAEAAWLRASITS